MWTTGKAVEVADDTKGEGTRITGEDQKELAGDTKEKTQAVARGG